MKEMDIKNVTFRNINRMDDLYFEVVGLKTLLSENPVYEDSITENAGTDKEVCTWVKIYGCGLAGFGITYKHDPRHNNKEYTWSSNATYINSKFKLLGSKYELAAYGCGVREYNPDDSCYIGLQCTKELAVKIAMNNQDKLNYGLDAFIERVNTGAF